MLFEKLGDHKHPAPTMMTVRPRVRRRAGDTCDCPSRAPLTGYVTTLVVGFRRGRMAIEGNGRLVLMARR